jgi:hypothetical protein
VINDDRRVSQYHSGRRVATAGDMREPIALVRSERTPAGGAEGDSLIETLRVYSVDYAAVQFHEERIDQSGGGVDPINTKLATHRFFVRYDSDRVIADTDYLVWNNNMFEVLTTQILGKQNEFLMIRCRFSRLVGDIAFTQGEEIGSPTSAEVPASLVPGVNGDVFWNQELGST